MKKIYSWKAINMTYVKKMQTYSVLYIGDLFNFYDNGSSWPAVKFTVSTASCWACYTRSIQNHFTFLSLVLPSF